MLPIILFLETLLTHGFLLFYQIYLGIYEFNCFITPNGSSVSDKEEEVISDTKSVKLWGLPRSETIEFEFHVPELISTSKPEVIEQLEFDLDLYTPSVITNEHLSFFDNIFEEVNPTLSDNATDDMLTMEAWEEEPKPVGVSTTMAEAADSQINDYTLGEQRWVIEVIGEEQGYLHVSDGSGRAWINADGFGTFGRGDILSLLVDRQTDNYVELLTANMLQERSIDFSMIDDIQVDVDMEQSYSIESASA